MGKRLGDLWEKLLLFQEKMDKIIESIDGNFDEYSIMLPFDIIEYDDYILVKIDAPGVNEENFKIEIKNNLIIVKGIKIKKEINPNINYLIAERRFGNFKNIIEIPEQYNIEAVEYFIKNGVIYIKIKKI